MCFYYIWIVFRSIFPCGIFFVPNFFVFYVVNFLFCFGLKDKYGIKCAHWRGGDVTGIFLQGIPPRGGIRDAKERGEDNNIIGDVTKISVSIGGGET